MKLPIILPLLCFVTLRSAAQTACPAPRPNVQYTGPVKRGVLIEHESPIYPARAKDHGISGSLYFRAHILEDGTVGHLTVLSGPPELQAAAEKALYRWRYTPWTANGQPIDTYIGLDASFGLPRPDGSSGPAPKPTGEKISALTLQSLLVRSYRAERSKEAKKANIFGTVTLHITLDKAGRIADLGVLCGPQELEDAALETVRHWIYQPYLSNGQPTAVESTIDVPF